MEQIDTDNYNRHDALGFAVQYYRDRHGLDLDVIETADLFLNWLNGVEVN